MPFRASSSTVLLHLGPIVRVVRVAGSIVTDHDVRGRIDLSISIVTMPSNTVAHSRRML